MDIFKENERDLAESFLDDITGYLIETYSNLTPEIQSGSKSLRITSGNTKDLNDNNAITLETSDITLLFLSVFFMMKDNKTEIIALGKRIAVTTTSDELANTINLVFKEIV